MSTREREKQILRTRTKAIGLLITITAFAIGAHLFNPPNWPPLAIEILQSLHGPGFSLLALVFLWLLQSNCRSSINYLLAGAMALGIGLISEIAQIPGPRNAQISDLLVDFLGISGALGLAAAFDRRFRKGVTWWIRVALPIAAGMALGIVYLPTLWYSHALLQQHRVFPTLLPFERSWELATLSKTIGTELQLIQSPNDWQTQGRVAYANEQGQWGAFLSVHPLPNWSGYARLVFTAASASKPFSMTVCIRDKAPDKTTHGNRSCGEFAMDSKPKKYSIEFREIEAATENGAFRFDHVGAVTFSASTPGSDNSILIDNIRLER